MVLSLRETTSPTVARPASVSAVKALEVQLQALNQNIQKCKDYLDFRFSELESFLQNPPSTPFSFSTIQPPTLSLPPIFTSPTLHKQDVQMMTPTTASIESPFVPVPPIEPPPKPIVDNLMKNLEVVTPDVPVVDAVSKSDLSLPAPIKNAPQCRTLQSSKSVASTEGFKRVLHPMPIPAALLSSRQMLLEEDTYLQDQPQSELKCPPPPWNDNALMVFDKLPKPKVTLNCLMLEDALESLEKEHHANKEEKDMGTSLTAILVAASPDKRSKAIPQEFDPGGARAVVIEGENDRLMRFGSMTTHIYIELQSKSSDIPTITWAINLEGRSNALIKGFDPGGIMSVASSYEVLLLSDFKCSRMSSITPRIWLIFGVYSIGSTWSLMALYRVQSFCWWFYWGRKVKFKIKCGCENCIWLFPDSQGEINAIPLESNAWEVLIHTGNMLDATNLVYEYTTMACAVNSMHLSICHYLDDGAHSGISIVVESYNATFFMHQFKKNANKYEDWLWPDMMCSSFLVNALIFREFRPSVCSCISKQSAESLLLGLRISQLFVWGLVIEFTDKLILPRPPGELDRILHKLPQSLALATQLLHNYLHQSTSIFCWIIRSALLTEGKGSIELSCQPLCYVNSASWKDSYAHFKSALLMILCGAFRVHTELEPIATSLCDTSFNYARHEDFENASSGPALKLHFLYHSALHVARLLLNRCVLNLLTPCCHEDSLVDKRFLSQSRMQLVAPLHMIHKSPLDIGLVKAEWLLFQYAFLMKEGIPSYTHTLRTRCF